MSLLPPENPLPSKNVGAALIPFSGGVIIVYSPGGPKGPADNLKESKK